MPSLLFLLILGGLAAAGSGGSSSSTSTTLSGRTDDDDDSGTPGEGDDAPVVGDIPIFSGSVSDGGDAPDLPESAYDIGWSGLSAEEQLMVELVNRARLDPAGELGRQDDGFAAGVTTAPKEALAVVETLSDAADNHSSDMDNRDFFAHTNPDGDSPADRAVDEGHGTRFVGENIGWIGSSFTGFDQQSRVENHHDNLWESDGHQQNFMSDAWSEIGVGYDYGDYLGYAGSTFATEMFSDTGESYLTGVVIEDADGDEFYDIGEGQGGVRITAYDGEDSYATATWEAGGYTLALPPGTYRVVFEGGDLDDAYETDVTIGSENVKLDVIDAGGSVLTSLDATVSPAEPLLPTIEAEDQHPVVEVDVSDDLLFF